MLHICIMFSVLQYDILASTFKFLTHNISFKSTLIFLNTTLLYTNNKLTKKPFLKTKPRGYYPSFTVSWRCWRWEWLKWKSDLFLFFVNTGTLFKENISITKVSTGWELHTFLRAVYFYWVTYLCQVTAYSLELWRGHRHNSIILLVLNIKK